MQRTIPIAAAISDEDAQRADLYALLARLFRRAPDATLLAALASQAPAATDDVARGAVQQDIGGAAPGARTALADAWRALTEAAAGTDAARVAAEHDAAFGGVGRPEILLQGSYWMAGFLHERPLAELRAHLARLGLARAPGESDTEDHVALLCETMRWLIRGGDPAVCTLAEQRAFFRAHLGGWVDALLAAIASSASTDFYRHVARLAGAFFDVERQAFDME